MSQAKLVTYHSEGGRQVLLAILETHNDGTIDIGPVDGEAVVTGCLLGESAVVGTATLVVAKVEQAGDGSRESVLRSMTVKELKAVAKDLKISPLPQTEATLITAILAVETKTIDAE